jgi:hypothetical protein
VHSGAKPIFFNGASSSEPHLPYPALTMFLETLKPDPAPFSRDLEIGPELAPAWTVLSDFCSVVNFAAHSEQRITVGTFLDTMASVMYRLVGIGFEAASSDETIRLGLLCFSCSLFLHWQHLGLSYPHLASVFRACFPAMSAHLSPRLVLWLLMVGKVSVFDGSDDGWFNPLFRETMATCEVGSWSEVRDLLMSFMWIGLVHDKAGKRVFSSAVG